MNAVVLSGIMLSAIGWSSVTAADLQWLPANDPAIQVRGAAGHDVITGADGKSTLRLTRPLDMPGKGYGWDNPGARVIFATAARHGAIRLRYSDKHISTSARNGIGLVMVDDAIDSAVTFTNGSAAVVRPVQEVEVPLPVPVAQGMHTYAIVMPYGDSVDVLGIGIDAGGTLRQPVLPAQPRWVAYGDSVTQGFTASHIGRTYPWLVGRQRGWEMVNLGLGGRACTPSDADAIAGLHPDLVTIAIGVNDWQGNQPPATYGTRLGAMLDRLHALIPQAQVAVITPLWVDASWLQGKTSAPLADYRAAAEAVVAARRATGHRLSLVDGAGLIDHDPKKFDHVAVHPNDAGFAQMAERLAAQLFQPGEAKH